MSRYQSPSFSCCDCSVTKCHPSLTLTHTLLNNENSAACHSAFLQTIYCLEHTDWSLLASSGEDGWLGSQTIPESWLSAVAPEKKNRKRLELNANKQKIPPKSLYFNLPFTYQSHFQCKIAFCKSSLFFSAVNSKVLNIKSCSSPD